MRHVAILSYPGQAFFELGCAVELFSLARSEIPNWYSGRVVSFSAKPQEATGGVHIQSECISSLHGFDMLVIPSWPTDASTCDPAIKDAIIALYKRGGRIISFCSGAFLLAQLGLLDGRRAITHWRYAELFKQRFPHIIYLDDVLFEIDGQIGCSAGSAAGLDLGLDIIRQDFGYRAANMVARRLVISAQRSGGQSQYIETPVPHSRNALSPVIDWALQNLNVSLDVNQLAQKANMSRRTFDRRFRATFNQSPKVWIVQQKLHHAKTQLECSQDSIETVAINSGFETAMTMRHNFKKHFGLPPSAFRQSVFSEVEGGRAKAALKKILDIGNYKK